jgi:hypothetical protein
MAYFSSTVAAQLAGRHVTVAILGHFDFGSEPMRLWLGDGPIRAGGFVWQGIGRFASISGLESAINGTAPVATFALSGVDASLINRVKEAAAEVKGRDVTISLQFFNEEIVPLDGPYAFYAGVMDTMALTMSGPDKAAIEVTAESVFARRGLALWGNLSDRDQNRLHPGDRLLESIPFIPFARETWPIIEPPG